MPKQTRPNLPTRRPEHSVSLEEAAAELGRPIEEITPTDLLDYPHEDLPDGPRSPLGGEVSYLKSGPESETRRMAEIGRKLVDETRAAQCAKTPTTSSARTKAS